MPEFPTSGPIDTMIRIPSGVVEVTAEARDTAVAEVTAYDNHEASHTAADETRVEMQGNLLVIEAPKLGGFGILRRGGRLRVKVSVPLDSHLDISVASADVSCRGRFAGGRINTASGDVHVEHIAGDLNVHSASGDVHAVRVDGLSAVTGASSDITIDYAGDEVSIHTASGDVGVGHAEASVSTKTASGDIRIGAASRGTVQIAAASGDVRIGVVEGTGVWLDLSTVSGSTRNGLTMGGTGAAPSSGAANAEAQLQLKVRTVSGDIDIYRTKLPTTAAPSTAK
jgi:hypothetical protein